MDLSNKLRDRRQRLLLGLARRGSEAGFRRLYRELHPAVWGYVSRRVRNEADAEDLTSRVFHKVLVALPSYDGTRGSVWTWVMTMTRRVVIDHFRTSRGHETTEGLEELLASEDLDPLAGLIATEEASLRHGSLAGVSEEVRRMFALRFVDGLPYSEIAESCGLSEAAVKQRFSRTLRRLRHAASKSPDSGEEDHANA